MNVHEATNQALVNELRARKAEDVAKVLSTKELVDELIKREGVDNFIVGDPSWAYAVAVRDINSGVGFNKSDTGPAIVLVVID